MSTKNIQVTKRDGRLEPIQLDKIHRVLDWAAENLNNVSVSQVELKSHIQFYDGIRTDDIHQMLIKSAADLISVDSPDYQYMAARLAIFHLRKIAYGEFTPPPLYQHITNMVKEDKYDSEILDFYTEAEINELDGYIDHWRDMNFAYAGVKQLEGKYLVQNRVTGQIYESPQMAYMLISMCLFAKYDKSVRLDYVKRFYDAASLFKISLPTPIMSGVRTKTRQFSSCVLIDCGDSLDSINASTSAIVKYVSQRAGIGLNGGRIRGLGSPIRGGEAKHTGLIPFYKMFEAATKSCSQGGVRSGAITVNYPVWHIEFESLIVLKNNRGVEENRIRKMDYCVQFNGLFYKRLLSNADITLFSPDEAIGLYEAFYRDDEEFERLYTQYEQDPNIRKKVVKAKDVFSVLMQERASTGRIYIMNVDHMNKYGSFTREEAPIYMTNLCTEIGLPTKPFDNINSEDGEIALCTLAAVNLGTIKELNELQELSDLLVRALDELLDYQNYPVPAAYTATMARRSLGIGVINFAYYMAKHGLHISDKEANNLTHRTFEALQYYLLMASNQLAKEKGACPKFNETDYAKGLMPIDRYKKDVDDLHNEPLHMDWDVLRENILKYGLRNSVVSTQMPSETSSQVSNATNGIEFPRSSITIKSSKDGILKQVVPEVETLRYQYDYLWDIDECATVLKNAAVMQKFIDQSLSLNTFYDPKKYENGKVPMNTLLRDLLTAYKYGLRTLYYHNTRDGADDTQSDLDDGCAGGACKI